jgi:1,4-alpha-glucan branching enzyme
MGGEFGQTNEWSHDGELAWELLRNPAHQGLANFTRDLNRLYLREPALHERDYSPQGFEWVDFRDQEATVVSFRRRGFNPDEEILFIFNFTPTPRHNYRLGAPRAGYWREIMNSDSTFYGGSNLGLAGGLYTEDIASHGQPYSLNLTLPPLAMLALKM